MNFFRKFLVRVGSSLPWLPWRFGGIRSMLGSGSTVATRIGSTVTSWWKPYFFRRGQNLPLQWGVVAAFLFAALPLDSFGGGWAAERD